MPPSCLLPSFLPAWCVITHTDLLGQHANTLKVQARKVSGQAGVLIKNIQQRALEKAKQSRPPVADTTAGHGLHAE